MRASLPTLSFLVGACGPSTDAAGSATAAAALCTVFSDNGTECVANGPSLTVHDHKVDLAATVPNSTKLPNHAIVTVRVQVSVDGRATPQLAADGVADAALWDRAVSKAVVEWQELHAQPIAAALLTSWGKAPTIGKLSPITLDGWTGHLGEPRFNGASESDDVHPDAVLFAVRGELSALDRTAPFHGLQLTLAINEGRVGANSTCLIDGQSTPSLCKAATAYAWPGGSYTVQQAFVVTPR